jgi:hypothetical protein
MKLSELAVVMLSLDDLHQMNEYMAGNFCLSACPHVSIREPLDGF